MRSEYWLYRSAWKARIKLGYEILQTMNEEGFRNMPVLKIGKLKGLVSSRDVLKHLLELADLGQATMRKLHDLGLY